MSAPVKRARPGSLSGTVLLARDAGAGIAAPPQSLQQLPPRTRELLLARGQSRQFPAGALLFGQGDVHEGIFLIQSGVVRSFYVSEDDRELTLGFWGEGHFVGAPQMFGGGHHAWSSQASAPVSCLFFAGAELRQLSAQHADLCLALLDALSHKAAYYCALLQMLATHSMKVRLARLLHTLCVHHGARAQMTHGQLAGMVGSTRQWVSQTLAAFEAEGLIRREADGCVLVVQPEALSRLR